MTKDADLVDLKARRQLGGALVWLRFGNMGNRGTAERLIGILPKVVTAIAAGEAIVEVR